MAKRQRPDRDTPAGSLPVVAIVGRPNVGKSTLFNRLVGKKLALVDDQPGVTRDRREGDAELLGLKFRIVDTAGFEEDDAQTLPGRMRAQTEMAVQGASIALFMIDARAGITPLDEHIARWLRAGNTPVVLLANKAEGRAADPGIMEAFSLGFDEPVAFSAEHGQGLADLFQAIRPHVEADEPDLPVEGDEDDGGDEDELDDSAPLKLAIVGRPNAGKSTLINRILGEERLITGPEAGITRDSIAVDWTWHAPDGVARAVRLIDTAGMRKRAKVQEKLEKLSVADALHAVDFAEVVVLMLDATLGLEAQDLRIADKVLSEGRALVIALNKWDVAENGSSLYQGVRKALEDGLAQVRGVPLLTVSGATGKGIDDLLQAAFDTRRRWSQRVPTSLLNRWFDEALEANPPPAPGGKRIKMRYITQARSRPPTFVVFGSRLDEVPESYSRYLVNGIRKALDFSGVPIRLNLRSARNPFDKKK
ncbi:MULTISPECIES: ribosome biogenesis GTPase Der [unclassified Sphingobium]|uniref:ribosome biogenesis GTPase Der n=1 Tax=unclassified Sphingobium TaxID=2611147 RepID=UPI002224B438|nr:MULTISPECIES: ribosome biogenesis GTPase Der [unclassified Sphingobium]MCW2412484.1 GTP-binding protein [Sphingobium sp. B8D3D]MCW2415219.1 GTP-binding protein [Sphingobium sp. B8D3A]